MKREILFRGKDNDGIWRYGFYAKYIDDACIFDFKKSEFEKWLASGWNVDKSTVGQYTGAKDKNGLMIFEGDIVKQTFGFHYNVGCACMTRGGVGMLNPSIYEEGSRDAYVRKAKYFVRITSCRSEVIGNIYDNPEMLLKPYETLGGQ